MGKAKYDFFFLNIINDAILNKIYSLKHSLVQKLRHFKFKKKLFLFVNEFFNKNDGTIITTGRFSNFFENYHVTECALNTALNIESEIVGEKEYVEMLISKFKSSGIDSKTGMSPDDERILREFFCGIYKLINDYIISPLPDATKYIINNQRAETKRIIEEFRLEHKKVFDYIESNDQISNSEIAFNIFEVLKQKILDGELKFIKNILPLLEGKNDDVENGLKIIFSSFSEYNLADNKIELLSKVKSLEISKQVEEILILEFFDDFSKLDELRKKCKNEYLCQIIDSIKNNKRDDFYKLEITKKDHIVNYKYINDTKSNKKEMATITKSIA